MALTVNTAGNPWVITGFTVPGTPVTVLGVQKNNLALPFLPTRIVWVDPGGSAGDTVILQDLPGFGGTATPRNICYFVASIANFMPPQEWKPSGHAAAFMGLVVKQFDGGELHIFQ